MRSMLLLAFVLTLVWPRAAGGQVQIHEFLAKNVAGIQDEKGDYEDWLEIVNLGSAAVDISGYHLTDDLLNPSKWKIPAATIIPAGQTLLFWADEEQSEGPYHTNFKLDKEGEEIGLVAPDAKTVVDSVKFGQQTADVSTGRIVGQDLWVTFPTPTPRALNQPEPCGNLAINARDSTPNPGGDLDATSGPKVGQLARYRVTQARPSTAGMLALGLSPFYFDTGGSGVLFIHPGVMVLFPVATDAQGTAEFPIAIPNVGALAGVTFYLQAFVHDGTSGGLTAGLITRICP
jgi:hypothetical protein